jgi:hypothetical protein
VSGTSDFEGLLREALAPVEPPLHLVMRLEQRLQSITELAAEELEAWELSAMRDPRNWARPAAALVLGTGAGAALVLLRARRHTAEAKGLDRAKAAARNTLRDMESQAKRLLGPR